MEYPKRASLAYASNDFARFNPYLKKSIWYTIMADECSYPSNAEQFVVCICLVDDNLEDHEDVIGLYNVNNINSETLKCPSKAGFQHVSMSRTTL